MKIGNLEDIKNLCFHMLDHAQVGVSGHRVGAVVVAANNKYELEMFGGCNIEFSSATGIHAERVALVKAISEGFTKILNVYVTSSSVEQRAALCGYCRHDFMYLNPNCGIIVLNPDKSIKLTVILIDTLKFPYLGKGKIK